MIVEWFGINAADYVNHWIADRCSGSAGIVGRVGIRFVAGDVAVLLSWPAVGVVTTMVMVALPPLATVPRLQVMVLVPLHVPWLVVDGTKGDFGWQRISHGDIRGIQVAVVVHCDLVGQWLADLHGIGVSVRMTARSTDGCPPWPRIKVGGVDAYFRTRKSST